MSDYAVKINALLAKAASTTSEAERDAFTEKAESLMVKWGIDDAMLDAASRRDKARKRVPIEERRYSTEGRSAALMGELAALVAPGIAPVRALISRGRPVWWCIGYADDLARVEMYIPNVIEQARAAWRAHLRDNPYHPNDRGRARTSFYLHFGEVVRQRFVALFRKAQEDDTSSGVLVVLTNRANDVDAKLAEMYPNLREARGRKLDSWAGLCGAQAGREASLAVGALQ